MAAPSSQEFRETVRSQTDLVSLIGESISLQPRNGGRLFVGLCPFHDDSNPSLNVYPDRQTFRCWSCQTGGDCFTFLMKREKVTFPEALELLARRANVPIPQTFARSTPEQDMSRAKIFEVLQWAENEFHHFLMTQPAAAEARKYLTGRGFTEDIIKRYKLGFHPDDWTWLVKRAESRYPTKLLLDAKLIGQKEGRFYDYFVNRVLFPIHNERGQPVSFGGRVLPGSQDSAKYWNGPESTVFHKSRLLYAIDYARDFIKRANEQVIVVEGYTDCLTCHQYGIGNVVATLGTALTDSHVTALKRYAKQVVLVFDGDRAGQDAAKKAVERFLAQDVELRILSLPENLDPAEFLQAYNAEEFLRRVSEAPEAWEFYFRATRARNGGMTVTSRQRILEEMVSLLAKVPGIEGTLREGMLVANLALRLQVPDTAVWEVLQAARGDSEPRLSSEGMTWENEEKSREISRILKQDFTRLERVEYDLLEHVLAAPETVHLVSRALFDTALKNEVLRSILDLCLWEAEEHGELNLAGLLGRVEDPELKSLLVWMDEQAVAKGLAEKLRDGGSDEEGCPHLLTQAFKRLQWCREEQNQSLIAGQLALKTSGSGRLDDATEEALLAQAAEFHRKRANQRTSV